MINLKEESELDSYLIRVYRRGISGLVVGRLVCVTNGEETWFHSIEELIEGLKIKICHQHLDERNSDESAIDK